MGVAPVLGAFLKFLKRHLINFHIRSILLPMNNGSAIAAMPNLPTEIGSLRKCGK
jgi:hypothetical protein